MSLRRAARAISLAALVAAGPIGLVVAATGACSLIVPTDGLSTGAVDASATMLDASTPDVSSPDGGAGNESDAGDAGADARVFPATAIVWSVNGHAYDVYIDTAGLSWTDARARAEQAGGHLATLGSADENDFVKTLVTGRAGAFAQDGVGPWLGAWQPSPTAADEPAGGWEWIDGTPWSFTDWTPGQPDNSGGAENYLDFYVPDGTLGWNDNAFAGSGGIVISYVVEFE